MFKKTAALAVATIAVLSLTACGSAATPAPSSPVATSVKPVAPVVAAPVSWDGTWATDPAFMSAEIAKDTIKINIVTEDTTALYWQGAWPTATAATDGAKIVSDGDVEVMSGSLMASQDATKNFTYANDELSFSFSMAGVTKTVHLKK